MRLLIALLITVVPAQQRFGNKVTVLLDVSGSLLNFREEALAAALEVVALTATDETEIRIAVFGDSHATSKTYEWPVDVDVVRAWVTANTPTTSQCTVLYPAWKAALSRGDVVLVSDCMIDDLPRCSVPEGRTVGVVMVGNARRDVAERLGATGGVYRVGGRADEE